MKLLAALYVCLGVIGVLIVPRQPCSDVTLSIGREGNPQFTIKMPSQDKESLDYFFRQVLFRDSFSYTLLGSKPLSFGGYMRPFEAESLRELIQNWFPYNLKIKHGWETWQKYQHLFNQSKFAIWAEQSPFIPSSTIIILADRQKVNALLEKYQEDFTQALQIDHLTGDDLLHSAQKRPLFRDVLNKDERLMGMLLGYGKGNAELYCKRRDNLVLDSTPNDVWEGAFWEKETVLKCISHMPQLHDKNTPIADIVFYPFFVGDPNTEESQQLKEGFLEAHDKIVAYFEGRDFVEAVLSLFVTDMPPISSTPLISSTGH